MHERTGLVINLPNLLRTTSAISILCAPIFVNLLASIGVSGMVRTLIMMVLCYVTLMFYYLKRPREVSKEALLIGIVITVVYYITLIMHPEYKTFISGEMWTSIISPYGGVVTLLVVCLFKEKDDLIKIFSVVASIEFVYYGLQALTAIGQGYWVVVENGISKQVGYSMSYGYHMLFPVLLFGYLGLRNHKRILLFISILGALSIIMLGSRMTAVCVVAFFVLYLIFVVGDEIKNFRRKLSYILLLLLIGLIMVILYEQILTFMGALFENIGFSSRTVTRILEGTVSDDAARNLLFINSQSLIKEGGLIGHGFLADRYFLGSYCHNIFLELFIEFGYLGGTLISAAIILIIIYMFVKCKDSTWKSLFLILFCCSFLRLLVSYSLWIDSNFWIMLGIFFCYRNDLKQTLFTDNVI